MKVSMGVFARCICISKVKTLLAVKAQYNWNLLLTQRQINALKYYSFPKRDITIRKKKGSLFTLLALCNCVGRCNYLIFFK